MTRDVYCSTAAIATSFDVASGPRQAVDRLSDSELGKLERRYRSRRAAVVVQAFQSWLQQAEGVLPDPERRGVVLGTVTGAGPDIERFLDESISAGDHLVNPALFPMTVHHAAAGVAAIAVDCRGPNVVVSAGLRSPWSALEAAYAFIHDGSAELVFVGGFESQRLAAGERGTIAAVLAIASAPSMLGRSYLAPLAAPLDTPQWLSAAPRVTPRADRGGDGNGRPGQAPVTALIDWAAAFAPVSHGASTESTSTGETAGGSA